MLRKLLLPFLFVAFFASQAFAQTGSITGTVTNEQGEPVPTANVLLVEVSRGAATNLQGEYTIDNVEPGTYTLRVTFVGYKTYKDQVTVEAGETLTKNITLTSGAVSLGELVVTAYGVSREKRSLGYQAETIESEEISAAQAPTAAASLIGKVAGLQINNTGGGVKAHNQIILRGLRSVTGNNEAQIVIDGVRTTQSAFQDLNPNSIQSINVLKGATAAALYGSDAVNGVLVVTTKNGQRGSGLTAAYTHTTTWNEVKYVPDHQTKFGIGWDGAYVPYENTNWGPRLDGQMRQIGHDIPEEGYPLATMSVPFSYVEDQLLNFFETGMNNQNTIELSGGDETSSFYLAFGNVNATGVIPHDKYEKQTFTANAMRKIEDVTLTVNANYIHDERNIVGNTIGGQGRAIYWFLLNTPINIPLTQFSDWDDPTSHAYRDYYFNAYYQNPYEAIGTNRDIEKSNRIRGSIAASWDVIDNINVTGRLGVDSQWGHGSDYRSDKTYSDVTQPAQSDVTSFLIDSDFQSTLITGNLLASGQFDLTEDINLDANIGTAMKMTDYRYSEMRANNLSVDEFWDVSNGTGEVIPGVNESQYRTYGFFGSFTLGYQDWVYLTASGRKDYTSTLPAGENSYFYPGVGLSVILSDAVPAIGDVEFLSFLKVTANVSTVYSDLNPYQVNEVFIQSGDFPFGSLNGFYLTNTAIDDGIQKEKLTTTEFGLNSAFFGGRVTFDAAYYLTTTTNLITYVSPSNASGSTSFLTNIGELSGSGLELTLGADVISTQDFTWNVKATYTRYQQTVESIKPGVDELPMLTGSGWGIYAIKGEVFPQLKAVSYVRDDQGRVVVDPLTGNPEVGGLQSMGNTTPEYIVGLHTQIHYKGFTVSATADYRANYVYYARGFDFMEFTGRSIVAASANRDNFIWPNSVYDANPSPSATNYVPNTNIPISGGIGPFWRDHYNSIKSNYVRDATALKIRELVVSYSVPTDWLSATKAISELTVSFVGRNLFTARKSDEPVFSDPEFKSFGGNALGVGGYLTPPPQRSYGISVNIQF